MSMSLDRLTSHFRPLFVVGLCLPIFCMSAGCSSFSGFRTAGNDSGPAAKSRIKTFLAVGDKPLPVVTGEPGSTVQADEPTPTVNPRRAANAENRISGRVYDENGEPLDGATVRLAINGVPGGKVNKVTTDPSGGFTLRGLRPGSQYTLIAEYQGNDGPLTGRANAETSDTNLKITLAPLDAGNGSTHPSAAVNRVSNGSEREETEPTKRKRPVVNEEDLPPAEEAELGTPGAEDDGPNPLPPAIEPGHVGDNEGGWSQDDRLGVAERDPEDPLPPARPSSRRQAVKPKTSAGKRLQNDGETAQLAAKTDADTIPGALVVVPETFTPVVIDDKNDRVEPVPSVDASPRSITKPIAKRKPSKDGRPTWGDVVSSSVAMPRLEGAEAAVNDPETVVEPRSETESSATEAPTPNPAGDDPGVPDWAKPAADAEPPVSDPLVEERPSQPLRQTAKRTETVEKIKDDDTVFCDYDSRHRKLNDFRLPGLDGNPVRFQDIDADLILLDFWGTWCRPCLTSIPKLVQLQARNPGKRLAIVGIACEPGDVKEASARVSATAKQLKINYPVLLSRNDGSCPLQEAFHIQAFPTLILVDRKGGVVWSDQGATTGTFNRLERLLLENSGQSQGRLGLNRRQSSL